MNDVQFTDDPRPEDQAKFVDEPRPEDAKWSDLPGNIIPDAKEVGSGLLNVAERAGKGIADLPKDALESAAEVSQGLPASETPYAENLKTVGGMAADAVKGIPEKFMNLFSKPEWIKHPVGNAMGAAAVIDPLLAPEEGAASALGKGMAEKAGGMASDLAETSANTIKKINPDMLGEEAAENIRTVGEGGKPNVADIRTESGKKLIKEGVVGGMGQDIGDRLQAAAVKADDFGKNVRSSIEDVKGRGGEVSVDSKSVLNPLLDKWVKLGDSSAPAMAKPYGDMYTRLEKIAAKNGGRLTFEDIDTELHDPGLKESFKKAPDSRAYEVAKTKYAILADARDQIVGQISKQTNDPKIASNLMDANKGYSYYSRIAKDMESPAAGGITNGPPSPQRALLRGSLPRAALYTAVQQVKPALASWLMKGGPIVEKYGSILESAAKQGPKNLAMTDFVLKQKHPDYAEEAPR